MSRLRIPAPDPGLCGGCGNARIVETRTGSRFFLCRLAAVDPRFPRYPRLPVLLCAGYVAGEPVTGPGEA